MIDYNTDLIGKIRVIFSKITQVVYPKVQKKSINYVLNKTFYNFNHEISRFFNEFQNIPLEIRKQTFEIFKKHFIICLMNESDFMKRDRNQKFSQIEHLINKISIFKIMNNSKTINNQLSILKLYNV